VTAAHPVACLGDGYRGAVAQLLARFGLSLEPVPAAQSIPGSYWGEPEAGLARERVYARDDTPVHSVLHEACHAICMGGERRATLDRDAGGDHPEETAVCYLQVVLARRLAGYGEARCLADMDAWGYSFRLGSAQRWFAEDAADARAWLAREGLLGTDGELSLG
jgi:hypothetical protein